LKKSHEFCVRAEDTLLEFLLKMFRNKSRNYVKGILKRGQIAVDGRVCTDYACALSPGQMVTVSMGKAHGKTAKIPILYEDDELIVVDKPAGMLAISTDKECENTAYHIITEYLKSKPKPERVFIVHRLDRETSGVMLFAKNEKLKHALQESWDSLVVRRGYTALVEGEILEHEGCISSWLKQTKTLFMYSSNREGDGKLAVTEFRTVSAMPDYSLLDITIHTGRKNQIRVHMSDMGHPIAGDKKYGAKTDPLRRLGLHASVLTIKHPYSDEQMCFESKASAAFVTFTR